MDTDFYSDLADTAIDMVAEFGTTVQYIKYSASGGDYDPSTGSVTLPSPITIPRKALLTDQPGHRINSKDGQTLQDGTLIQGGDKWVYFVTDAVAPLLQDHCNILGIEYVIKDVQMYGPSGVPLLYLCVLR